MKKWWIVVIVILVMIAIFFFPKSCGGGGGTGGPWHSTECECLGFKAGSILNRYVTDAVFTSCYGLCLKSSCEKKVYYGVINYYCKNNSDCVPQCSNGCVNKDWGEIYKDSSECLRAWDCSCVNNICYTDGKPPPK